MSTSSVDPASASPTSAETPGSQQRWLVLAVVCIAQLMVVLDATVVNIALPSAQRDLGFGDVSRQWVVSGYSLAFGSLLLLGGRVAGSIGYRRAFLIGMAGFAVASALGGGAVSFGMLVAARVLQGIFAALLAPAALSLLTTAFTDPRERSRAFGVFGAVSGVGGGLGLLVGGVLTQQLSWRWCLLINIGFAIVAGAGALATRRDPGRQAGASPIDVPGAVLATLGLSAVVLGLADAASQGWSSPLTWGPLVAGGLLLAGFARLQQRTSHPLLPPRLLADRDRVGGYLVLLVASVAMFALFLFLTYYLQETLGYGPILNGLAYLPMIAVTMLGATVLGGPLIRWAGVKVVVPTGMLLTAAGLLLLTRLGAGSSYAADVLPPLLVFGLGVGLSLPFAVDLGTARTEGDDAGTASALVNAAQQVGGSIGIAVLTTLAASVVTGSGGAGQAAVLAGYSTAYLWSAVILAAGAVAVGLLLQGRTQSPSDGTTSPPSAGGPR